MRGEAHCKLHHNAFGPIWREGMRSMGEKTSVIFFECPQWQNCDSFLEIKFININIVTLCYTRVCFKLLDVSYFHLRFYLAFNHSDIF